MPTGLSVLCLIRPDSGNLIIWFRSPEQNRSQRHRLTRKKEQEGKATRQQSPQFCWQGHSISDMIFASVIQYYSLETCLTAMVRAEEGPGQHIPVFDIALKVPDTSVVSFHLLSSNTTWYDHTFYWSGSSVILITALSFNIAECPAYWPHEVLRVPPFRT